MNYTNQQFADAIIKIANEYRLAKKAGRKVDFHAALTRYCKDSELRSAVAAHFARRPRKAKKTTKKVVVKKDEYAYCIQKWSCHACMDPGCKHRTQEAS